MRKYGQEIAPGARPPLERPTAPPETPPVSSGARARRGTTNRNDRGGTEARRRRREWLVETYRADVDAIEVRYIGGNQLVEDVALPACRCYRCGILLTVDTVTVDRIIPGCRGGTYRRSNIRPACGTCNSVTGATTRRAS